MITNDLLFREQPQCCYIEFPTWPLETDPQRSLRKPRKVDDYWFPSVPPYRSYENDKHFKETVLDFFKSTEKENFSQTKEGNLKFRLGLAGFSKEDVSVVIEENKYLKVSSKNSQKPYSKGFVIPNAENYNLSNPEAQMTNGLLEIFLRQKKEEVRAIKIL